MTAPALTIDQDERDWQALEQEARNHKGRHEGPPVSSKAHPLSYRPDLPLSSKPDATSTLKHEREQLAMRPIMLKQAALAAAQDATAKEIALLWRPTTNKAELKRRDKAREVARESVSKRREALRKRASELSINIATVGAN